MSGERPRHLSQGGAVAVALVVALVAPGAAFAAERVIEMFTAAFIPQSLRVRSGDAVTWVWRQGEHTVTSGLPDGSPGTPDEPGLLFDERLDADRPLFTYVVESSDGVTFFDRNHPDQIGFLEIDRDEVTVRVAVVDNVFNPEVVAIFEGDTVRWEHEPGEDLHTVTSGLSSRAEDRAGLLFDEDLSEARPIFAYRFEVPGDQPYFCRPHESMGMVGVVRVQRRFLRGDVTREGELDVSDAVAVLESLFLGRVLPPCDDAADTNDDGILDLSDPVFLLGFLFLGGVSVPPPYPAPGADRSPDDLRCWADDV